MLQLSVTGTGPGDGAAGWKNRKNTQEKKKSQRSRPLPASAAAADSEGNNRRLAWSSYSPAGTRHNCRAIERACNRHCPLPEATREHGNGNGNGRGGAGAGGAVEEVTALAGLQPWKAGAGARTRTGDKRPVVSGRSGRAEPRRCRAGQQTRRQKREDPSSADGRRHRMQPWYRRTQSPDGVSRASPLAPALAPALSHVLI